MDDGIKFADLTPAEQKRLAALVPASMLGRATKIRHQPASSGLSKKGYQDDGLGDTDQTPKPEHGAI